MLMEFGIPLAIAGTAIGIMAALLMWADYLGRKKRVVSYNKTYVQEPYTWEQYSADIRNKFITIEEILTKCGGKVPEKPEKSMKFTLGDWTSFDKAVYGDGPTSILLGGERNSYGGLQSTSKAQPGEIIFRKPTFRVGDWVRTEFGSLLRVTCDNGNPDWIYCEDNDGVRVSVERAFVAPALPKKGEWWEWVRCASHGAPSHAIQWPNDSCSSETIGCCIRPVNFGRGNV